MLVTIAQINYLNIGLMLISCLLAFILPFELFLFSYAFLGPLHYLTEISWLHKRNYFTAGKKDYFLLIIICLLTIFSFYFKIALSWFLSANAQGHIIVSPELRAFVDAIDQLVPVFIFIAFGASLILILIVSKTIKLISYFLLFILAILLGNDIQIYTKIVNLPTLIKNEAWVQFGRKC